MDNPKESLVLLESEWSLSNHHTEKNEVSSHSEVFSFCTGKFILMKNSGASDNQSFHQIMVMV